jgi:AraC family transcriptional regulator
MPRETRALRLHPEVGHRVRTPWPGLTVEKHSILPTEPRCFERRGDGLLLCFAAAGKRHDGEVTLDGVSTAFRDVPGRLHLVPADCRFTGWVSPAAPHEFFYVWLDPRAPFIDPALGFAGIGFAPRAAFEDAGLFATARKLAEAAADDPPRARLAAEALGSVLAVELARRHGAATPRRTGGLAGWRLRRAEDLLTARLDGAVGLAEIAAELGLSPWHFCRAFRESTGDPPHRWLARRRIAAAQAMLRDPGRSVTDIALAVGFGGTTQFARAFRRATGLAPTEYRRRL